MKLDYTVNLGHVLVFLGFIFGAISTYITVQTSLDQHTLRLDRLEERASNQMIRNDEMLTILWSIRRDLEVLKDRSERQERAERLLPTNPSLPPLTDEEQP